MKLELQPQFLINRAILGKTNSYKNSKDKNINLSDLFGLNINLNANNANWSFDSFFSINIINSIINNFNG